MTYEIIGGSAIRCLVCGMVSHNPNDVAALYCGQCHRFHLRERIPSDKEILLMAADGPESIEIYTSEDEGIVDWSGAFRSVYLVATLNGAMVKLGPFQLATIHQQLVAQLRPRSSSGSERSGPNGEVAGSSPAGGSTT